MKTFVLQFFSLPAVSRLNRRLAGLALLWLLTLLLLKPAMSSPSARPAGSATPAPTQAPAYAALQP